MPSYSTRVVTAIRSEREGLQRVDLDNGRRSYVLTQLIGPVAVGDRVVVNTTAVDLGLGTGGWDVVHWNLSREAWSAPGGGHVLKLRYTSLQVDTGVAEGTGTDLPVDLGGMPVVACDLHSQMACVAAAFASAAPDRRLVYVMTDSAALPAALSDVMAELRMTGVLAATVTSGQAFGGDLEAVNIQSALQVARTVAGADAVVVSPGPGTVGTGTRLGFGGLEVAGVIVAAAQLMAQPIIAVRYSGADARDRHQGVSHHTRTSLEMAGWTTVVPIPRGEPDPGLGPEKHRLVEVDVPDFDFPVTTMGRTQAEDPEFFRYAAAAGLAAAQLLSS